MLNLLVENAWAVDGASGADQGGMLSLLPLILVFVAFWFFLIRPQMKQAKEHKLMVAAIVKGDEVVTNGGILGKVVQVGDNFLLVEIAKDVQVKVQKNAVTSSLPKGTMKTL